MARTFAVSAAELLTDCIMKPGLMRPALKFRLNLAEMTGLPYSELVRQSLTSAGNNPRDLSVALPEVGLIISMVLLDDSPVFQDVIASQMVVTWSASIMMLAMSKYEELFSGDPNELYDRTISTLGSVLCRACLTGDRRPAVEVVDSKVLHFVEWRSRAVSARMLCVCSLMIMSSLSTHNC